MREPTRSNRAGASIAISAASAAKICTAFAIRTLDAGVFDVAPSGADWFRRSALHEGLLTLFVLDISASLAIQEIADPDIWRNMSKFFYCMTSPAELSSLNFLECTAAGPADMPVQVNASLLPSSLQLTVING